MTAEPREQNATHLLVSPEPTDAELAAIVAVLRNRHDRAPASGDDPRGRMPSRWETTARREAVWGNRSGDWRANWRFN